MGQGETDKAERKAIAIEIEEKTEKDSINIVQTLKYCEIKRYY